MKKDNNYSLLLALYGSLLTDKQFETAKLYFFDDYSLQEIAVMFNISKPAVHDAINKVKIELYNIESKLNLLLHKQKRKKLIDKISDKKLKDDFNSLEDEQWIN